MPLPDPGEAVTAVVHRGTTAFEHLRPAWQAAVDRATRPSLFVTPTYVETAWQHFAAPGDEPWLVAVQGAEGALIGLLPLACCVERRHGLPWRVLRHIGCWGGDRPGILHAGGEPAAIWRAVLDALLALRRDWQQLDLRELDQVSWLADVPDLSATGAPVTMALQPDTYSGVLTIRGTWEEYFASRSKNTRQAYRRRQRQLEEACPDLRIEVIDAAGDIAAAFDRYVAIERLGWKSEEAIGLWADPREIGFHHALLPQLARTGQASVWLLRTGDRDIAGLVRLHQGSICYERYSAFDPAYARYSPGTLLCMEAVRQLFGTGCTESDVLGLHEPLAERPAISAWYDDERATMRLTVTRQVPGLALARQARQAIRYVRQRPHTAGAAAVTAMALAALSLAD